MNQFPPGGEALAVARRPVLIAAAALAVGVLASCSSGSSSVPEAPSTPPTLETPSTASTNTAEAASNPNDDPQLTLLKRYEDEAGVAPGMMKFIGFPKSEADSQGLASDLASTLQTWHTAHVRPLIIMEPTFNGGADNMDLYAFDKGDKGDKATKDNETVYTRALEAFFKGLKDAGVTDEQMGTWVPFPEPNMPSWAGRVTDPEVFIRNTTRFAEIYRTHFPQASLSVMLDSQTFLLSPDHPDWINGTMDPDALLQYLKFKPGVIDSFGLQGFTWTNQDDAAKFLSGDAAVSCAQQLGVQHVWFNTGTYSTVNNPDSKSIITAGKNPNAVAKRRAAVLQQVLEQVPAVQKAGLRIDFVNVFGQNKLDRGPDGTGTADYQYTTRPDLEILGSFVSNAKRRGVPVTIFDAAN